MKNFNKTTDDVMDMIWNIAASKKKIVPPTAVETLEDFFIIFGRKLLISLFVSIKNVRHLEGEHRLQVIEVHKDKINVNFYTKKKIVTHVYPILTFYNNGTISIKDEEEVITNCIVEGSNIYVGSKSSDNYVHDRIERIINRLERTLLIRESKIVEKEYFKVKLVNRLPKVIKANNNNKYEFKLGGEKRESES